MQFLVIMCYVSHLPGSIVPKEVTHKIFGIFTTFDEAEFKAKAYVAKENHISYTILKVKVVGAG